MLHLTFQLVQINPLSNYVDKQMKQDLNQQLMENHLAAALIIKTFQTMKHSIRLLELDRLETDLPA